MISVRSGDARKGLGLGLRFGGGGVIEMEESELEEGEACSYQNHEDYNASIDPDVDLSYIDEKIHDVLGHFQKDFEGGVSAENLGAKFGGYGSFLPMYQRSPITPRDLQIESGQIDPTHSSTTTVSVRLGSSSASSSRLPAVKAPSTDDGINQEKSMTTTSAEAFTSKYDSVNTKFNKIPDQKTLKVRIKVGADNLSTRKNAAIYSGLGLDVSPSSSLDDSPSESEGISREPQDAPFESPTSILQIMTSLPMLLSPLPDHLIQLTEKETCFKNNISAPVHMVDQESSGMLRRESNIAKGDRKTGGKKMKSLERCVSSVEVKGDNNKNTKNDVGVLSTKECGIDALTTEELVSNTLKLPLLSSSYSLNDDLVKCVDGPHDTLMESNKGMVREKTLSDQSQKERVEPTSTDLNISFEKAKGGSGRKVMGDKDNSSFDESQVYAMDDNPSGVKTCGLTASESVSQGGTALNIEHIEPPKKAYQRGSLGEQDGVTLPVVKEHPFNGGKKSKGSHGTMVMERGKEISRVGTPAVPKTKKSSDLDSSTSKNEADDVRIQKDHGKTRDTYRDFFGELEEEEDRMDSLGTPNVDKLKDSEVVERSTSAINCAVKEKAGNKKVKKPSTFVAYSMTATDVVRSGGNVHVTDVDNGKGVPIIGPPVVIEDHWVQCDRCQKWRLLPVGTNTDNLPEKWLCSMLYWLPDMNRCSVSEAETNKALSAPEGQINLQNNSGSVMTGGTVHMVHHPDVSGLNPSLHVPSGKKKVVKELSNSVNKDGISPLSSSVKKNLQSSVKSRSLNDVNKSPAVSEPDILLEKHKNKQKILEHNSDRGDTKNLKMKSRRDPDQDCSRSSKKGRTDEMHSTDEEWITNHSGTIRKVDHSSNSIFPTNSIGKDRPKHKERSSSRDSKYDAKDRLQVSVEKATDKDQSSFGDGSLDLGNYDTNDGVRKRKLKEYQNTQNGSTGHHQLESRISVKQEFSDCRKEKKARISKSEGRESTKSKGSGKSDKKVSHTKNQRLTMDPGSTLSHRNLDGMDCSKRDSGSVQASAAATSSSSKVSGSHKTKASFQEVKGSPVESVSSSPMRILNTDKLMNRELREKDDSHDNGAVDSPKRCSDGEDDGGSDRSQTARKDKSLTMVQDKDVNHITASISKEQYFPSPDVTASRFSNGGEERPDDCHTHVSHPRKTGKGSTSHLKDDSHSCKSEFDAGKVKNTSSLSHLQDQSPQSEAKHRDGRIMLQKSGLKSDKSENANGGKKDYMGNVSNESRKQENQIINRGHNEVSVDAICKQEALTAPSQNQLLDCDAERSSRRYLSERTDQEVPGKAKALSLPPSGGSQIETLVHCPRPVVGSHKGNGDMAIDPSKFDDAPKLQKKPTRKADNQNGTQRISSRHPIQNGNRANDLDAPSPIRRDSSSHAANGALREAKDLKHLADRLKNSGSSLESTGIYFQAALKFLHGASLLESANNENAKHNEMIQSNEVYSSTAKLCEFCAHEYEKLKDMAAAALAYKCMEVAYMRVIYSSHSIASSDRNQLQTALQKAPLGESPSSSASDVDNVNNCTVADKVASCKGVSSPLVAGSHVIAAQNRHRFVRLLNFARDVNFAMEASRKSRIAFAVANANSGEAKNAEGISSIKKALDFNFQDVEGLLRLVRLAMEAINR
ncbi:hypothetical protein L6164_034652 [Bauhinia variegata]|uniref:Uncharacterized protein n=1 Tax=Bauhinia variegata TaxID=167791 RepID=A0ACB9KVS6_BAUVA|nr:hypothetical protein L6164_034652 [Bauhinia variegata]